MAVKFETSDSETPSTSPEDDVLDTALLALPNAGIDTHIVPSEVPEQNEITDIEQKGFQTISKIAIGRAAWNGRPVLTTKLCQTITPNVHAIRCLSGFPFYWRSSVISGFVVTWVRPWTGRNASKGTEVISNQTIYPLHKPSSVGTSSRNDDANDPTAANFNREIPHEQNESPSRASRGPEFETQKLGPSLAPGIGRETGPAIAPLPGQTNAPISNISPPTRNDSRAVAGEAKPGGAMGANSEVLSPSPAAQPVETAVLELPQLPIAPGSAAIASGTRALAPAIRSARISRPDFVLNRTVKAHSGWVTGVAFSSDGQRLASGSWDQTVKFWDVPTGKELSILSKKIKEVQTLALSSDGQWLAAENSNNTVTLWDASSGREVQTLQSGRPMGPIGSNWVYSIAFSPDGRWLASALDDKTIRVWDVRSGHMVRDLTSSRRTVIYAAFSPDGRWVASGDDEKSITIWDVTTGEEIRRLTGHKKAIYAAVFGPGGRWLASASADKTIKIWDISTGREIRTLTGHADSVTSLAWSADGRWLASGSWDKTIKIWDTETGQEVQTLTGYDHSIYTIAFDRTGRWLASGAEDGTIKLWRSNGVPNSTGSP